MDKRARSREVGSRGRHCRSRSLSAYRSRLRGRERGGRSSSASRFLVVAHAVGGRGLLTATALGVDALGRVVPGLDPRIDIGHAVTALGVGGRGLLTAPAPAVSVRVSHACRGVRRDRSRSRALPNRSRDRSRSSVRLPASPARLRSVEAGRLARRGPQEGVEAFVSQPPVAWCSGGRPSCSGGASIAALPSVFCGGLPSSSWACLAPLPWEHLESWRV